MQKKVLVTFLAVVGVSSAYAAEQNFKMFTDKKIEKKETPYTSVMPINEETTVISKQRVIYKADGTTEVQAATTATTQASIPNLEKLVAEKNQKAVKGATEDVVAKAVKTPKATKMPKQKENGNALFKDNNTAKAGISKDFSIFKNTAPNGLHAFPDNGVYDNVRYTPKDPAMSEENKAFYEALAKFEQEKEKFDKAKNSDKDIAKFDRMQKLTAYKVFQVAEKGNENAIDYLCINPHNNQHIQVDVMKYHCDIASKNIHMEFLGYRAWEHDDRPVKVAELRSNRKSHDRLVQMTLKGEASWALLLEAKHLKDAKTQKFVVDALKNKKSYHWLHYSALRHMNEK